MSQYLNRLRNMLHEFESYEQDSEGYRSGFIEMNALDYELLMAAMDRTRTYINVSDRRHLSKNPEVREIVGVELGTKAEEEIPVSQILLSAEDILKDLARWKPVPGEEGKYMLWLKDFKGGQDWEPGRALDVILGENESRFTRLFTDGSFAPAKDITLTDRPDPDRDPHYRYTCAEDGRWYKDSGFIINEAEKQKLEQVLDISIGQQRNR